MCDIFFLLNCNFLRNVFFLFRYKEDIGEDNNGVVTENNENNEIKESENTMTVRRRKSPSQNRKKLRVSIY